MFKELVIPKRNNSLVTLSSGGVYTNHEYTLLYIGIAPTGMSAEFKIINTDPPSGFWVIDRDGKPDMKFIGSLSRILLC